MREKNYPHLENIADLLWLSKFTGTQSSVIEKVKEKQEPKDKLKPKDDEVEEDKKSPDSNREKPKDDLEVHTDTQDDNSTSTKQKSAKAIKSPKKLALSNYREWERAFKFINLKTPSKNRYELDEEKTVESIASLKIFDLVFRKVEEKSFFLTLIIDQGETMELWSELIKNFEQMLMTMGVFARISLYYWDTKEKKPLLYVDKALKREVFEKLIVTDGKRNLVWVMSDCIAPAWKSGEAFKSIDRWATKSFTSILQMFPKEMWMGTMLFKGKHIRVSSNTFNPLNQKLQIKPSKRDKNALKIPIISFDPYSLQAWAKVVVNIKGNSISGIELKDLDFAPINTTKREITPEMRMKRFYSQASPTAQKLAFYMSVLPVDFQVTRILQEEKLPKSNQAHVAEVFLGGLIERTKRDKSVHYEFYPKIREELNANISADESFEIMESMSDFVSSHLGIGFDFKALLADPKETSRLRKRVKGINIYNEKGKKLITKEEIEAQRKKEEKLIFFNVLKLKQVYINREVDALLSNRIAQKKGCVLFLFGQGGVGKSSLLEKFRQTNRPTIYIHINERIKINIVDIFLDESNTSVYNCPKFEEMLDEIFFTKENEGKIPFDGELKLLNAIKEDFGNHGVFIVDTFEKNKNSNITSQVKFDRDKVRFVRSERFVLFRDYLNSLVYQFISNTTFVIAGRNRSDEQFLDIDGVEEIEMENFSISNINQYIQEYNFKSFPNKEQLNNIKNLTQGNPLLVYLLVKVAQDYEGWDNLDYNEMKQIIKRDEDYGLLFYMTNRILSHIDNSKDIWKLVIPRILTKEIENLLFNNNTIFMRCIDTGLIYKGLGKKSKYYYLHDTIYQAIVAYYEREFKNGFSSWHEHEEVIKVHKDLIEYYKKDDEFVNTSLEGCYHKIMLKEGFESNFEITREEFANLVLDSLSLNYDEKLRFCKQLATLSNSQISKLIKTWVKEKEKWTSLMSQNLYDRLTTAVKYRRDNQTIIEDVSFLESLKRDKILQYDESLYYLIGKAYDTKREYYKAIEAYRKIVEINPKDDLAYFYMGDNYSYMRELNKAIESYLKAVEINSTNDRAYNNIGGIYIDKEEYDKSIEAFQKSIEINPINDNAYYNLGFAYSQKKEYDKSIESLQKSIEINPINDNTYMFLGQIYNDKKEYNKSIEAFQKSIEINPINDNAYYNLGLAYSQKKEYDKSIESLQKSIEINPRHNQAYYNMGIAYGKKGEYDKAIVTFKKITNLDLNSWNFNILHEWIDEVEDKKIKSRLEEAWMFFQS